MPALTSFVARGATSVSDDSRLLFTASTNNQVSTAPLSLLTRYTGQSKLVSGEAANPTLAGFNTDGTRMFVVSGSVYQYALSTAWDVSTASFTTSKSLSSQDAGVIGVAFSGDGTKMYAAGSVNDRIYEYDLSTAWSVSTATYTTRSFSIATETTAQAFLRISTDGTEMYVTAIAGDTYQYTLGTAWDVSTASFTRSVSLGIDFMTFPADGDGSRCYATLSAGAVKAYTLTTPWDISTLVDTGLTGDTLYASSVATMFVSGDETKFYTCSSSTGRTVFRSDIHTEWFDLASVDSLSWQVEVRAENWASDILGLDVRVMNGATVLAAADAAGTWSVVDNNITSSTDNNFGPTAFAYVNTAAARSVWGGANLELRQRYTISMGDDGANLAVDFVELTGTYTAEAPPASGRPVDRPRTGMFTAVCRASSF